MKNTELKSILYAKYGNYCENCIFPKARLSLHHVLIHDQKRWHDELTNEYNCGLYCMVCHPHCNGHEKRVEFLTHKIKEYGKEKILEWINSLPEKLVIESWIIDMLTEPYEVTNASQTD